MAATRHHSQRERMQRIDSAESAHRSRHRNLKTFGKLEQFAGRAAVADRLADKDDWAFRAEQHIDSLHDAFWIGAATTGNVAVPRLRVRRFLGSRFHEHVIWNIQNYRSGTAGHHGFPGLPDGKWHHLAARRLKYPLTDAAHGRWEIGLVLPVHLLKGAAIELAGRYIAGHRQEGHRVKIGGGERDRQLCRTWTARCKGRSHFARNAVINVGHEAGDAFVVRRYRLD